MILGIKIAVGIILSLFFAVAIDCAFYLINAPDDMSVIVGVGIFLVTLVVAMTIATYLWNKLIKWFKNNRETSLSEGEEK